MQHNIHWCISLVPQSLRRKSTQQGMFYMWFTLVNPDIQLGRRKRQGVSQWMDILSQGDKVGKFLLLRVSMYLRSKQLVHWL